MNWESNKSSFKAKLLNENHDDLIDYTPTKFEIAAGIFVLILLVLTFLGN